MHTITLQLVNNKSYPLNVSLFKGLSYACAPSVMDCVEVVDTGGVGYSYILSDIYTNEIKIHSMKVIFAGNPSQARYSFRERFQSSTGTEAAKNISVESYMSAQQKDNTIAEMNLRKPIRVGGKRFLDYMVDKNTTVTLVIQFNYSNEKKNSEYRNFVDEEMKKKEADEKYQQYLKYGYTGRLIM